MHAFITALAVCYVRVCWCMCCIIDGYNRQGRSKVFTTGQARINPEHYVIKCVANDNLLNAYMAFLSLAV